MDKCKLLLNEISATVGEPRIELRFDGEWQLLVAVILSAQCTDARVNKVTENLFSRYPDIRDYTSIDPEELRTYIYSTGFYKNKAKNIVGAARHICEHHHCRVPSSMDMLVKIPGVGRKTANVILSATHSEAEGIVVDTHVRRVSKRLGFTESDNPVTIEKDLMSAFPKRHWKTLSMGLVLFGRYVCKARKPACLSCGMKKYCEYYAAVK